MKKRYKISGMSCNGCAQIVHSSLSQLDDVKHVTVDRPAQQAEVEMVRYIPVEALRDALSKTHYKISEIDT